MSDLHVVFGASGGAGAALVRELAGRGHRVRAVSRGGGRYPDGVEQVRADAEDAAAVREAARGAAAVYHSVNAPYPEWARRLPGIMDNLIGGAAEAGARLVYADNLYMYGPTDGPMVEDTPVRPDTRKGALRARLADALMDAHARGRVRAAIGRASDFYGPPVVNAAAGDRLFGAALAGKRAMWVGRLDVPHSLTFTEDFARVLATLGERNEAPGHVWHAPDAGALTGREFAERVFEAAGKPARVGTFGRPMVRVAGVFSPVMREFVEMMYQFERPFVLDGGRFTRTFGIAATPHDEAIRRVVDAFHRPALAA
jgi:nucleoside-diphosphate-sugar epimerase